MINNKIWKFKKLGEVVEVLDNLRKPINSTERLKRIDGKNQKDLFPYYGATGQVGWIDSYLTDGEFILVGEDGAPFLDNFKNKAYKIFGKTWVNNHAHILKGKEDLTLNSFILYYLNSIDYRQYVNGTTRLKLTKGSLVEIPFPVPPLETQQFIVSKIEELFSELDQGIADLKTAQAQLKVYRQSVLKHAFEGKLTNKNVKEGELPEGWEWTTIGDIFEVYIGSTPKRNVPEYWGGTINWVSSGEIAFCNITKTKEKITSLGLENTSCKVHPIGTVIIAMIGEGKTRGQAAILKIEASHNQNTAAIRVDNNTYLSELLYYYLFLKYQDNRKVGSGNNQKALNKERVKGIEIPLPPIEEQHQIVQEIESRLSVADKMEESIQESLQKAEALRQSILKKAFSGELV